MSFAVIAYYNPETAARCLGITNIVIKLNITSTSNNKLHWNLNKETGIPLLIWAKEVQSSDGLPSYL